MPPTDTLAHNLRARHVAMIALGGVIGAGFFIGSSAALSLAGPAVMLSYIAAGVLTFLINLMMRDLSVALPGCGSFVNQIRTALGPQMGFLSGWAYWLTWMVVVAIEVIAGATMLAPLVPLPFPVLEILLLGALTAVNLMSVKGYGEFEYWFALTKVVAIVAFIVIGFWSLLTVPVPVRQNLHGAGGLLPHGWLSLLTVIPTIVFSMSGSEIATVAAVESDDPDGNIARATRSIALRIGCFYLLSIALVLCLVPWQDVVSGQSPFLLVLNRFHVPFAGTAMGLVIFTAVLSTLNSGIYATSRVLFELCEKGDGPSFFLVVDPATRLPRRAVLVCGGGAVLIAATAIVSPGVMFALLVSLTGSLMLFNALLQVFARLKVVRTRLWAPVLMLILLAMTFGGMMMTPDTRYQLELGTAAIVIVLIGYRFLPKNRDVQNSVP